MPNPNPIPNPNANPIPNPNPNPIPNPNANPNLNPNPIPNPNPNPNPIPNPNPNYAGLSLWRPFAMATLRYGGPVPFLDTVVTQVFLPNQTLAEIQLLMMTTDS